MIKHLQSYIHDQIINSPCLAGEKIDDLYKLGDIQLGDLFVTFTPLQSTAIKEVGTVSWKGTLLNVDVSDIITSVKTELQAYIDNRQYEAKKELTNFLEGWNGKS